MTWPVIDHSDTATPRFKVPLSRAVLDDPAFSPDPRSHPHFPLPNVGSYKAPPSKSPPRTSYTLLTSPPRTIPVLVHPRLPPADAPSSFFTPSSPSLSSESDSLRVSPFSASTSPTLSSATSPTQTRGSRVSDPVSALSHSPPNSVPPPSTQPKVISKPPPQRSSPLPVPEILPKPHSTSTLTRENLRPVASQNRKIPRKGRMKALVRRLTSRHNLDRIDELDETDPFGGSYHHDGPYEAIEATFIIQLQNASLLPGCHPLTVKRIYHYTSNPARSFDKILSIVLTLQVELQFQVSFALSQIHLQSLPDLPNPEAHHYQTPGRVPLNTRPWIFLVPSSADHHPCILLGIQAILETTPLIHPIASHSIAIVMLRLMSPVKQKRPSFLRPDTNLDSITHVLHDRRNELHHPPSIPRHREHSRWRVQYLLSNLMAPDIKVYIRWIVLIHSTTRSHNPLPLYKISL
ncbi:hypothetical protein J3R83DRAFT_6409 [Lanmaoa asiatica]|nr:hypothetical protein J3R83DRAFT_6409 [Lanmaoa asiatica]